VSYDSAIEILHCKCLLASYILFTIQVILTHANQLYLDHPSEPGAEEPGLSWATISSSARNMFDYIVPVDDRLVDVSSFVKREICKRNKMSECIELTHAENIIGWLQRVISKKHYGLSVPLYIQLYFAKRQQT